MIGAVKAQRERLKARVAELELEREAQRKDASTDRGALDALRRDNAALYEVH